MTLCEHLSLVRTRIMNDAQCASVLGQCPVCLYAFTYEIDAELERPLFYRLVISKSLDRVRLRHPRVSIHGVVT